MWRVLCLFACAILMVVGAVGPWIKEYSTGMTHGAGISGLLVGVAAVGVAVLTGVHARAPRGRAQELAGITAASLVGIAVAAFALVGVAGTERVGGFDFSSEQRDATWGPWLALVASTVALLLAGPPLAATQRRFAQAKGPMGGSPTPSSRSSAPTSFAPAVGGRPKTRIEVSAVGLGIVLLGALAMIVAVFLPRVETRSVFGGVAENTMIQFGDGYVFIGLGLAAAAAAYHAYRQGRKTVAVIVLGIAAIAFAVFEGTSEDLLTLYPLDESGQPDTTQEGEKATPSVGIYLAAGSLPQRGASR